MLGPQTRLSKLRKVNVDPGGIKSDAIAIRFDLIGEAGVLTFQVLLQQMQSHVEAGSSDIFAGLRPQELAQQFTRMPGTRVQRQKRK